MRGIIYCLFLCTVLIGACVVTTLAEGGTSVGYLIDSVPQGYYLYMYDDCGI